MLRRLAPIITTIFFVLIPLFFTAKVFAADSATDLDASVTQKGSLEQSLQEFCKKRQGNQMNLETWYSGKCTDDTFSGEGVGFSDIVILDLAEKVSGKKDPNKTFSQTMKGILDMFKNGGTSYTPQQRQLAIEDARQKLIFGQDFGLVGQAGKVLGLLYKYEPASTQSYLAYVTQNLQKHNVIPPALAATTPGIGFSTFSPFLPLWTIVRNLAYLMLVVFFIVYGFMMMFRVNLGQKTVITVQLAIPKLIVTLLIITFSYAIVGLVYDLMWVLVYFFIGYLQSQKIVIFTGSFSLAEGAYGTSVFAFWGSFLLNAIVSGPAAIFGVLNLFLGGLGAAAGTIGGFFIGGINLIISLVVIIAVLISYGKLFFKLIGAFISVIISLITGPILLLGNAFPGSQAIGKWFRSIIANLFIFPITMLFLLFSYMFMIQPILGTCSDIEGPIRNFFTGGSDPSVCQAIFGVKNLVDSSNLHITGVPLISPPNFLGGFDARGLLALVGIGLLLMASKYVDMVQKALNVSPFAFGTEIGAALKSAQGMYTTGKEEIQKVATSRGPGSQPPAPNTPQVPQVPPQNTQTVATPQANESPV